MHKLRLIWNIYSQVNTAWILKTQGLKRGSPSSARTMVMEGTATDMEQLRQCIVSMRVARSIVYGLYFVSLVN